METCIPVFICPASQRRTSSFFNWWYNRGMKVKTSVTLSEDLLRLADRAAKKARRNRSEFIENAVSHYLRALARHESDASDLAILNAKAETYSDEAFDVLAFQKAL